MKPSRRNYDAIGDLHPTQLTDWNLGRQYERHGPIDGIPECPHRDLWPFVNACNAVARLHAHAKDHEQWPWPGRLGLVVRWLVGEVCAPPEGPLPLTPAQLARIAAAEPAARASLASSLREALVWRTPE